MILNVIPLRSDSQRPQLTNRCHSARPGVRWLFPTVDFMSKRGNHLVGNVMFPTVDFIMRGNHYHLVGNVMFPTVDFMRGNHLVGNVRMNIMFAAVDLNINRSPVLLEDQSGEFFEEDQTTCCGNFLSLRPLWNKITDITSLALLLHSCDSSTEPRT